MDLRAYYNKVRETELSLSGEHVVLVSLATPEGGKPGVSTEVPRKLAAKMIAEGRAREASSEETERFRTDLANAKQAHEESEAARRMQVMVIPSSEFKKRDRT